MLLNSLKLTNFRQFKDEQTILFSTDEQRNVTIIMGENGSGKTSLAQAFTWCLYGKTDFDDTILLNKVISQNMIPNDKAIVRAELSLIHSGINYSIISEQQYIKNQDNKIKPIGQRKFAIAYKGKDGQQEFVSELQTELRMKEILPAELSKYFFFDGERIGNMSKELKKGKSKEFADAVRNLLGLSAFTSAMHHLKGKGNSKSVIKSYDNKYDSTNDKRIDEYSKSILGFEDEIENIEKRLHEIEKEEGLVDDKINELNEKIIRNTTSKDLAEQKNNFLASGVKLLNYKNKNVSELLKDFNKHAPAYFAKKMMRDSLHLLSESHKLDKGVPDIHARTIDYIINKGRCICGSEVCIGNDSYNELNRLRDYIPPKSLGNLIEEFRLSCESSVKSTEAFFDDFCSKYSEIRAFEEDYKDNEEKIELIENKIGNMEDVGKLQAELKRYELQKRDLQSERSECDEKCGAAKSNQSRMEAERHELTLKDTNNKKIEIYKAYTQYLFEVISDEYKNEEARVRGELDQAVNKIFQTIYNGGFSLSLDEKYNIQVNVNDIEGYNEDVETSTAQSISIIFAFIAGVIEMARKSQNPENEIIVSEPYPLVMDAPLSAFDKTRIQTVCTVLPEVAEQVIIFIKDTDGEIAEKFLENRIGNFAVFDKKNEFETYIEER